MAYSFILAGVLTESITTTWNDSTEPGRFFWNENDWAGIGRSPYPIGEILNAHERALSLPLNGLPVASFRIDFSNPMADEIISRMRPTSDLPNAAVVLLKVYEGSTLRFVGDCANVEQVGDEEGKTTLQANFVGPLNRVQHRLAKKRIVSGALSSSQPNVSWSSYTPGQIITELLTNANTESMDVIGIGDTGIRIGTVDTLPTTTVGVDPPWNNKPIAEALTEMQAAGVSAELTGAFDFQIRPVEPVSDSYGLQIAALDIRTKIGQARPDVIFEYGDGSRSARSYRLVMDRQGLLNRAISQGADPTDDTQTVRAFNADSQTAYGLYEGLTPIDVGDSTLRQAWVDANVAVRGDTRLVGDFTPAVNAPSFGMTPPTDGDYTIGDTVRVRVKVAGTEYLDANMRVYGIDISIDDEGKETIKPRLTADA